MKILFEKSFGRDLKKVKDRQLLDQAQEIITQAESAEVFGDIPNIKKLQGTD